MLPNFIAALLGLVGLLIVAGWLILIGVYMWFLFCQYARGWGADKISRFILVVVMVALSAIATACNGTPTPIVVTATPAPATDTPIPTETITPTLTPTLDPLNPHEGTRLTPPYYSLVGVYADLSGLVNETEFHNEGTDIIFTYPQGFQPLCEPDFRDDGTLFPCPWVFPVDGVTGIYTYEMGERAGYFGLTFDIVTVLYPSDNYRYLVRCDIAQGTPLFGSSAFGIRARFLSDEFNGGEYNFIRQRTGGNSNSYVWVFEVSQTIAVTFQCGIDSDWGTYRNLNFTFSYMDIQIVPPDYGGDDYVTLP